MTKMQNSNIVNIAKNGVFSGTYQLSMMLINLVTRSLFLQYFGIQLLGINSTFTSILNTLSLAEMGFQTAIIYHLFEPLENKNYCKINEIMNIYRIVYNLIALFIFFVSICIVPLLPNLLNNIEVNSNICIYFLIQSLNTVFSYLFSYKRTLLFADKKDYICKIIDTCINLIFSILRIIFIFIFTNYIIYLLLFILQTFLSNTLVHLYCKKNYIFLIKKPVNMQLFKKIFVSVKDVFSAKLSNYVYSSTDNILISSMVGATLVGYLVNYTTIILQLKSLISLLLNPIIPIIGRSLVKNHNVKRIEKQFRTLTFFRFFLILTVVLPCAILLNSFIKIWIGSAFLLNNSTLFLLIIDFYISIIYAPCYEYLNAGGYFKIEKKAMLIAAILNIVLSIIFTLYMGLNGVLIGTVITQIFLWIYRSILLYENCFYEIRKLYIAYWKEQLFYIFVFSVLCLILTYVCGTIRLENQVLNFIISGIFCEILGLIIFLIFLKKSAYAESFKNLIISTFNKK